MIESHGIKKQNQKVCKDDTHVKFLLVVLKSFDVTSFYANINGKSQTFMSWRKV